MAQFRNMVNYFRACLQADNRSFNLLNFFGKKVEFQRILNSSELLQPKMPYIPIDSEWAISIEKDLELFAKEKTLYVGAFFVMGSVSIAGKKHKIFAPLLLNQVELIHQEGFYALQFNVGQSILNPTAVQYLTQKNPTINAYDYLLEHLPDGYLGFEEGVKIETELNHIFTNIDTTFLKEYPNVLSDKEVKKLYRSRKPFQEDQGFKILPALGVGLIQKTQTARGILTELREIAEENTPSMPLKQLLLGEKETAKVGEPIPIYVPVSLNLAQQGIFTAVHYCTQTLIIGPPGTGKSFTIAAIAADAIAKGQSVLIAAKNFQAVEVIAQKIEKDFDLKKVGIAASSKNWRGKVSKRLRNILNGIGVRKVLRNDLQGMEDYVKQTLVKIENVENILTAREEQELEWGKQLTQTKSAFLLKIKKWWIRRKVHRIRSYFELFQILEHLLKAKDKQLNKWLKSKSKYQIYHTLETARGDLQQFLKGIQARTGLLKENLFNSIDLDRVFHALPLWLVSASEVNQIIPLQKELFDLVIIDEATQCDIASAIPLLYRGKKAIIVGDPKQLRHISFLSFARQNLLQEQHDLTDKNLLNYRQNSILDLATAVIQNQQQVHFLNEHYRSLPDIIQFSNATFYDNALRLMTATPLNRQKKAVFVHQIEGQRDKKGVNAIEVKAVVDWVLQKIETEKDLPKDLCKSIGILSPFRDQVTALQNAFKAEIDLKNIERHQILIGTPFHFQGEEKDIMLLSFGVDSETHPSTFQYLNRTDVFNVSITRARTEQHLFLSIPTSKLPHRLLLTKYLASISNTSIAQLPIIQEGAFDDFLMEVVQVLHEKFKVKEVYQAYAIARVELDIVIVLNEQPYCIDLIGYPSEMGEALTSERVNILARMGVKTFPLTYSSWLLNRHVVVRELKGFLKV